MSTDTTDYAPAGILDDRDILLTTLRSGDVAATLTPIDWGQQTGGRWIIDSQSVAGLFSIDYDPATDSTARLVLANAALLPAAGSAVTVTAHYYDRYQIDAYGNPLPGKGIAETLVYNIEAGSSRDLAGFGADVALGAAAPSASPDLATLSTGAFVSVWQAADGGIAGQMRDAAGAALGAVFSLVPAGEGATTGAPAVAALAAGRSVVAYASNDGAGARIAYRILDAGGVPGAEVVVGAVASGADSAMPDVLALQDGSFALAWRSAGQVHVRIVDAGGNPSGTTQVYGELGTAFSPSLAATPAGYLVAWGEIGDGNVYAALAGGAPILVSGDGLAASRATAAPQPTVTALAGGGFVVAWDSYANSPWGFAASDIFFQRFDAAGQRMGEMTQANVSGGGARFEATTVALADGGFAIAWQAEGADFDGDGVFGRRFDADGAALDAVEFGINEMRQGDQANPVLSALAGGGLAAAWVDVQADGTVQVEARILAGSDAPAPVTTPAQLPDPGPAPAPVSAPAPIPQPVPAPSGETGGGATGGASAGGALPTLSGNAGADQLRAAAGSQKIDGMGGVDTLVYDSLRSSFDIAIGSAGVTVTDRSGAGGTDTLVNVERLSFGDVSVALDIDGVAGQAYRLYTAAFDRAPDKAGVGYWISMLDAGTTLEQVAAGFANSAEFRSLYGAETSDAQFVELLYNNVQHRTAEGAGRDYWIKALAELDTPREQVLAFFSESGENRVQVIGAIQNGIEFTPWTSP